MRHVIGRMVASADWVWARATTCEDSRYSLSRSHPTVTPAAGLQLPTDPRERNGRAFVVSALLVGIQKMHARKHSYGVAYTLSRSERDTEDWEFFAADQRDYDAERGPSAGDVRHRVAANLSVDLPLGTRLTTIVTAQSGLPYNITVGADANSDGEPSTDRPPGVGRNSRRESGFWQVDARLAKTIASGRRQVDFLAEGSISPMTGTGPPSMATCRAPRLEDPRTQRLRGRCSLESE